MRWPRIRFSVRLFLVGVAIISVSWTMFLGIADLFAAYGFAHVNPSQRYVTPQGVTVLGLVLVGSLTGGLGFLIKSEHRPWASYRPRWLDSIASAAVTCAVVVASGLILGGASYFALLIFVLAGEND